jgi:hypothetical protein
MRRARMNTSPLSRRDGDGDRAGKPTPGWKPRLDTRTAFVNPRPPAVPAMLDIRIEEYYAAASLMGLLASMGDEPDQKWACRWAFQMGTRMARESKKRRKKR